MLKYYSLQWPMWSKVKKFQAFSKEMNVMSIRLQVLCSLAQIISGIMCLTPTTYLPASAAFPWRCVCSGTGMMIATTAPPHPPVPLLTYDLDSVPHMTLAFFCDTGKYDAFVYNSECILAEVKRGAHWCLSLWNSFCASSVALISHQPTPCGFSPCIVECRPSR